MGKPTLEKIDAAVSLVSNSPGQPTGYGYQGKLLVERMLQHDMKVAALSNYGCEGNRREIVFPSGTIPEYPRGLAQYSEDVIIPWHKDFVSDYPDRKQAVFTLYDVWVYNNLPGVEKFDVPIISWVPLDHVSLPPNVADFLKRPNVTAVTMSPHGQRQLEHAGFQPTYIPHMIDTKVYKPTYVMSDGLSAREYLDIGEDVFLVGMVAANKANQIIHRKAYAENLLAFALFLKERPDAKLYIHAEPSGMMGGFDLPVLIKACGIPDDAVIFPDPMAHRIGFPEQDMAALYTAFDVLLHCSYGEGFGVPAVESQACGTRVIASGWAASQDLVSEDSWLVEGIPFYDNPQKAWYNIPIVPSIVQALELAYQADRGPSKFAMDFAKKFDVETVWRWHWLPFFRKFFA